MLAFSPAYVSIGLGALTLAAAWTDARAGRIPNALTLPVLGLAPLVAAALAGLPAAGGALGGIIACAAAPWLLHRLGACGGGDGKLLAAAGALSGVHIGLEIELVAFVLATLYGLGKRVVVWLRATESGYPSHAMAVRLGPWVLAATTLVLASRTSAWT